MKKAILLSSFVALSCTSFASVEVSSLDVYKNRTFINQEIKALENSVDLVGNVRFEDIRFKVFGNCKVSDTNIEQDNYSNDNITQNIDELKDKIAFKQNQINAIKSSISQLESISFSNESVNLQNIKDVSAYSQKQIELKQNKIFSEEKSLKKLNEDLKKLINQKNTSKYSKLNYMATCEADSKLFISYPTNTVSRNSFYEINANSNDKSIEIKNTAFITQRSGHDFKDIDINLYSYNFTNSLNPVVFRPKYLRESRPVMYEMQADAMPMVKMSKSVSSRVSKASKYSYNETATKSFFKASNISLKSGVKTDVTFAKDSYKADASIEIDGFGYGKAFYKVDFKTNKLYGVQNSKLYLDGIFVGNYYQKEMKKNKKSSVYFGEDRLINVKKELIKEMNEEPFFSLSKIKTQKLWKYTIVNNHKVDKTISLVERLPISTHEDIKVKLISNTNYTKKEDNTGKISYDFVLKANETKVIDFGYEVEKPQKK